MSKEEPKEESKTEGTEQKERKLKVEISRDKEVDSLQDELARIKQEYDVSKTKTEEEKQRFEAEKLELTDKVTQYEAEKAQLALEQFDKDKKDIIELCKASKLSEDKIKEVEEKIKTPQQLETVKSMVNMMIAMMPKPEEPKLEPKEPPAGKAPMASPETPKPDMIKDGIKMIDDIYNILNDRSNKYTPVQKAEANAKRMQLWNSLIHGKSWDQLRKGVTIGTAVTMSCPQCGTTIHGNRIPEKCDNCGFDFTKTGDRHAVGK